MVVGRLPSFWDDMAVKIEKTHACLRPIVARTCAVFHFVLQQLSCVVTIQILNSEMGQQSCKTDM